MIDLLRAQTATHHHGLESHLHIQNRLLDAETRASLIGSYSIFYRKTEAALRPHLWDMSELDFSSRLHSRLTLSKICSRRHTYTWADPEFAAIKTKAEALGTLYVLEGATLGGRVILKALRSQGVSTDQLQFLDPYGNDASACWRTFLRILEREAAHSQLTMNECVLGATKAFAFAAICLREESTH
jgi:heme oxygenase